jgi:hypothetical protein
MNLYTGKEQRMKSFWKKLITLFALVALTLNCAVMLTGCKEESPMEEAAEEMEEAAEEAGQAAEEAGEEMEEAAEDMQDQM